MYQLRKFDRVWQRIEKEVSGEGFEKEDYNEISKKWLKIACGSSFFHTNAYLTYFIIKSMLGISKRTMKGIK